MVSKYSFQKKKCYVYNIFTTLSQQILDGRLLVVIIGGQKCNISSGFKLKPITTNHLWFIVKILWMYHFSFKKIIFYLHGSKKKNWKQLRRYFLNTESVFNDIIVNKFKIMDPTRLPLLFYLLNLGIYDSKKKKNYLFFGKK